MLRHHPLGTTPSGPVVGRLQTVPVNLAYYSLAKMDFFTARWCVEKDQGLPGFSKHLIPLVRCLHDGSELALSADYRATPGDANAVHAGKLTCVACHAVFEIEAGILDLLNNAPLDAESTNEQRQRNACCTTVSQLDTPAARAHNEMEMLPTLEALPVNPAQTILEFGCGEGRYTVALAGRVNVLALDFSINLLRLLQRRLPPGTKNVGLVLGDITTVRVAPQKFDFALSTLTSNLPSREHRESLYRLASTALAPHGRFVLSSHVQGIHQRLAGEHKSDHYSSGGIYRYNFDRQELIDEMRPHFARVHVRPIQIYLPLARTLRLPTVRLSRMLERIPLLNMFGMLLLAVAEGPRAQMETDIRRGR